MLVLVQGPAGGNKSGYVQAMRDAGEVQVISDVTELWSAAGGYQRGPDGKFPVRHEDDPALRTALYLQTVAVGFALREGFNTVVTTSQAGQTGRWAALAAEHGAEFSSRVIDPGEEAVRVALADPETGELSDECLAAINRWYRP